MAFNQNQDTLKTLKLVIFLIVIEILFLSASVITNMASNKYQSDFLINGKLDINSFKFVPYNPLSVKTGNPNTYYIKGTIAQYLQGSYRDDFGHTFAVKEGDTVTLQKYIDDYNSAVSANAFDFLSLLVASFTFAIIPYPLNIIPILITSIIAFIILYLGFSEIKAWFSSIIP